MDCTWERAVALNNEGIDCAAAEVGFRRVLDLTPRFREAHECLAGILAGRGASLDAVREALGTDTSAQTDIFDVFAERVPLLGGDFAEVERLGREALARVPPTGTETEHFGPAVVLTMAYAEAGNDAMAGAVAADYLSRRVAWKAPKAAWVGYMVGAAVRGGRMSRAEADRTLDGAFRALVDAKDEPQAPADAWAESYAAAVGKRDEAVAALAKLAALRLPMPSQPPGRTLFLAGRGEEARAALEQDVRTCASPLQNQAWWMPTYLYLGELDEQKGDKVAACGHLGKILERWGHAKPKSVTADEARGHAKRLGCDTSR